MTTENNAGMTILTASEGMVLCDGYTMTSVRDESRSHTGKVYVKTGTDVSAWAEMTEAEADALIAANSEAEATEADYQESLTELGVTFDEEN